ncbi:MAG TPA: AmiS/UreI family transporter [Candidatus Dormibacteraeota bacterium]|jgi:hypothetical protein
MAAPLPITIVFFLTGIAVWANGLFFLGAGADSKDGSNPLRAVGVITLVAGIVDFIQAFYLIQARPAPLGDAAVLLAGLVIFYAAFFTLLGATEIFGLDLRPLGNVSAAVGLAPLLYWHFFTGSWMFQSILVFWMVTFLAVTATTYGKFQPKALGVILVATAIYTFWVPAWILATGHTIP